MSSSICSSTHNPPSAPTLEEILAEAAGKEDGEAPTTAELANRLGKSEEYVLQRLRALWAAGRLQRVWKYVERIDGQRARVPAWRIIGGGPDER